MNDHRMSEVNTQLGDFAVFGFTPDSEGFLKQRLQARLGINPRTIKFGSSCHFFFYTCYGDVAESEEAFALKLGSVRSVSKSPLSTQRLLEQKLIKPDFIDHSAFRGNALVACFSKTRPCFSLYQTLMALPQLYYTRMEEGILCATDLRWLFPLLGQLQLNAEAIPMHFLFDFLPGPLTYFRDIWRLFPGQMLKWENGDLKVRRVRDLRQSLRNRRVKRLDAASIEALYESMREVMGAYVAEIRENGQGLGNLLSGGVDSSTLQLLINELHPPAKRPLSFSFAVRAPSLEFEIEYARHASALLQTQHTFADIFPQDYPDLLIRTIETLGQPSLYDRSDPCKLALAEFLALNAPDTHCFFAGQGADALHGLPQAKHIALFELARKIPGSRLAFELMIALLTLWSRDKARSLRGVARMLADADIPESLRAPPNNVAISDFEMVRRCFGDEELAKAINYRLNLETDYLNSSSILEKWHVIDLLTAGYEPAVVGGQLFSARHKRLIQFFLDEDVIGMMFAFSPKIRFLQGLKTKPILKGILAGRSYSALTKKKKGSTVTNRQFSEWVKGGPLQEMVRAIDIPGFISKSAFDEMVKHPTGLLWDLLTFDIFQKHVLTRRLEKRAHKIG
jgi:hypothetical protein